MDEIEFRFKEKGDPGDTVVALSSKLQKYDSTNI